MRLTPPFLTLSFLSFFATFSYAFTGPTCQRIKDDLRNGPDGIFKQFDNEICKKGC